MRHQQPHIVKWWHKLSSRERIRIILFCLTTVGIAIAIVSSYQNGQIEWRGLGSNLSTGLIASVITFILLDLMIGGRQKEEDEQHRRQLHKERLIHQLRSWINDEARRAAEELRDLNWHNDGALIKASLIGTKLQRADLSEFDLRRASMHMADLYRCLLIGTNLQNAGLETTNLERAVLQETDLRGANLTNANLDGARLYDTIWDVSTVLPDGSNWSPESDMRRFTDSSHPHFWRSDEIESPAYRVPQFNWARHDED